MTGEGPAETGGGTRRPSQVDTPQVETPPIEASERETSEREASEREASPVVRQTEEWLRRRGFVQVLTRGVRRRDLLVRCAPTFSALTVVGLALTSALVLLTEALEHAPLDAATWDLTYGEVAAVTILVLTPVVAIGTGVVLARVLRRLDRRDQQGRRGSARTLAALVTLIWAVHPLAAGVPPDVGGVAELIIGQVVIAALVYGLTYIGAGTVITWSVLRAGAEVGSMLPMAVRVMPVLLITVLFFFFNSDVWQVVVGLDTVRVLAVALILVAFTVAVAIVTTVDELRSMDDSGHEDWHALADSPVAGRTPRRPAPPLTRGERINIAVIPVTALLAQIFGFVALTFTFFVLFGQLSISDATMQLWTRTPATNAVFLDTDLPWTVPLLKVATILAAFSGLSVAASAASDATYRSRYLEPILSEVRDDLAVRHAYLELLDDHHDHGDDHHDDHNDQRNVKTID